MSIFYDLTPEEKRLANQEFIASSIVLIITALAAAVTHGLKVPILLGGILGIALNLYFINVPSRFMVKSLWGLSKETMVRESHLGGVLFSFIILLYIIFHW